MPSIAPYPTRRLERVEQRRSAGRGSRGSRAGGTARNASRAARPSAAGADAGPRPRGSLARSRTRRPGPCRSPARATGATSRPAPRRTPRARATRAAAIPRAEKNPDAPTSDERRPRERAGERHRDRDDRGRDRHRDREPAGRAAAIRPSPSLRRNHNSPRPARIGFRTISARSPSPQPNIHEKAIVGSESHPDCGVGGERGPGHLERVPQRDVAVGERVARAGTSAGART